MAETIGQFQFLIREPLLAAKAAVHIAPAYYSVDKDGHRLLSPELMSEGEIDWHILELKKDLDNVGRRAKRALRSANQRTLARTKAHIAARKDEGK